MRQSRTHAVPAGDLSACPQIFRREGEYWTISYAGTTIRLRDGVGVRYLAELLAQPCLPLAAEALIAALKGVEGDAQRMAIRGIPGKYALAIRSRPRLVSIGGRRQNVLSPVFGGASAFSRPRRANVRALC